MKDLVLPFQFEGRDFEARALSTDAGFTIRVFEGDRPVTRATYSVTYETAMDMAMTGYTDDALGTLLELAKRDVVSKNAWLAPSS